LGACGDRRAKGGEREDKGVGVFKRGSSSPSISAAYLLVLFVPLMLSVLRLLYYVYTAYER
jgi:hypothetical protein